MSRALLFAVPTLVMLSGAMAGCGGEPGPGPVEFAPGASVGHWLPEHGRISFLYTGLFIDDPDQSEVTVTAVSVKGIDDGVEVLETGVLALDESASDTLYAYNDGGLPEELSDRVAALPADVRLGTLEETPRYVAFVTLELGDDAAQLFAENGPLRLDGLRIEYDANGEHYGDDAPHSLALCVGEPERPCDDPG